MILANHTHAQWGNAGTADIPIIIDDGTTNIIHGWLNLELIAYPVNLFIDHEMKIFSITEAEMNETAINTEIQSMLDNIPSQTACEDPIASNYNQTGECDYTDVFTSFEEDIQPIFTDYCTSCHGNAGGLSLENFADLMDSDVITNGNGENSTLYQRMISEDNPMPPSGLVDAYLAKRIQAWIDQGTLECAQGEDCAGECGGDAEVDCAGVCEGTAELDCAGECGGDAEVDCAGQCNGDAEVDCAGVCEGTAELDCAGECGGDAEVDCAGQCNGDAEVDCAGVCEGTAELDCAGECGGDAEVDCAGQCNGDAEVDCAGVCEGTAELDCAGECGGDAEVDCAGACEGDAVIDECGICNGDGSDCAGDILGCMNQDACNYDADATYDDGSCWTATDGCSCDDLEGSIADCAGQCNGDAEVDCAGVCEGTAELDCAGECGGDAEVDCAGQCNGDSEVDCAGVCEGTAELDCAGECGGDAEVDCAGQCNGDAEVDCAGVCEGTAELDCAGECGGDAEVDCAGQCNGDAEVDCAGECGGDAVIDECGICVLEGDNTCLSIDEEFMPSKLTIKSVYPNPFNPTVNVEFYNPNVSMVNINIVDLNGKIIETIYNSILSIGYHQMNWEATHKSSGIYFLIIQSENSILTEQLILLK